MTRFRHAWFAAVLAGAPTLLAMVTPCQAGEVTVRDDFDRSAGETWAVTQGQWERTEGAFRVHGGGYAYLDGMSFGDVTFEVDCHISDYGEGVYNWVGVVLGGDRRTASAEAYLVYVRYSGQLELYRAGTILAAVQTDARARFEAGQAVHLRVSVEGSRIRVGLDGRDTIQHDVPVAVSGDLGLAACDVDASFDNFALTGDRLGNTILGEVLYLPSFTPAPHAAAEIYHSMDGYDSPVTRATVADEQGRFSFRDLPAGAKAYWLRAGKQGFGGTTAWFQSVTPEALTKTELHLLPPPPHDIWVDSADLTAAEGMRQVPDPQCYGGSRIEVKEALPADERPRFAARFAFQVPREGMYTPHIAAGLYATPHYWSDFWWSVDDAGPWRASETLALEGRRYGDRDTLVWAYGPPMRLAAGKHTLAVFVRDAAPHEISQTQRAYWWSFDAAAFASEPSPIAPIGGSRVGLSRPVLRWQAPASTARFTVQYSHEPDFSNGTVTVAGVTGSSLRIAEPLADGTYYWRVKALPEEETPHSTSFTAPESFTVATPAPGIRDLSVTSRGPAEVTIRWRTDEPCTSRLLYGLSGLEPTMSQVASMAPAREHHLRVKGLEPMTYYYYWVEVTNQEGRVSRSLRRGVCTPRGVIADRNSPFGMFGQGQVYAPQMAEAGVRWYSDYWDWGTLEPERGKFDWTLAEERMERAEEAGVNLTVTFWGSPAWVRPSHPTKFTHGPDDLDDARGFFRALAAHCKGRTYWWTPWIEPNVARDVVFGFPEGYWADRPHARSYAAYQRAAYEGAKAGDPDCRVVGMNTAGVDLDFIRRCYDEGAADSFDVMNVHYYATDAPFERQDPERLFQNLRGLMSQYGDSEKPILCSEGGGASSGLPGTDEDTQADNLIRIYVVSIANNVDKLCWTFELDAKPYGSKRVDMIMWMGLFRFHPETTPQTPLGTPKPSYFAMKTMTENLAGTEYLGRVPVGEGLRVYRFRGREGDVLVAWAEEGEVRAGLPARGDHVTIVDRAGTERRRGVTGGKVDLTLTGSPVFVRE